MAGARDLPYEASGHKYAYHEYTYIGSQDTDHNCMECDSSQFKNWFVNLNQRHADIVNASNESS
jgi:hypothetical protein